MDALRSFARPVVSPLCAIVDADVALRTGWNPRDLASAYVDGGATFLQLRAKSLPAGAFLDLALTIEDLARGAGALLIVNDRADIARLSGAGGVHVGQDDLSPEAARAIVGPDSVVGLSTHTLPQIDAAHAAPISYLAVGPVFATVTKNTGYGAIGVDRVRAARARAGTVALVAIGGITLDRAADVIEAGASAVAVIADLLATGDPQARVRAYLARLGERSKV